MEKAKKDMSKRDWEDHIVNSYWKYAIGIILVLLAFSVAGTIGYSIGPAYEYHDEVLSHVENAESATTPELMLYELEQAEQGMRNLDLTNETYGAFWQWEKTPDRQMSWQYERIHALQQRTRDIISWRNNATANGTSIESLSDVYHGKIKHVQDELEDRVDRVAGNAYMIKHHLLYYFGFGMFLVVITLFGIWVIVMLSRTFPKYDKDNYVEKKAGILYEMYYKEPPSEYIPPDEDPPTL